MIGLYLITEVLPQAKAEITFSGNSSVLVKEGLALDNLGNHTGAILYYDKVLTIDPHNVNALNNKGWALNGLGNYTGAMEYYDKALAIDPRFIYALNNKGIALDNLGNHTGAMEYHDKASAISQGFQYIQIFNGNLELQPLQDALSPHISFQMMPKIYTLREVFLYPERLSILLASDCMMLVNVRLLIQKGIETGVVVLE